MKSNRIAELINLLYSWTMGDNPLYEIDDLLGSPHQTAFNLFYSNSLCDNNAKKRDEVTYQLCLDCLVLFLAMRHQ